MAAALRDQSLALGSAGGPLFDALFAAISVGLVAALHDVFLLGARAERPRGHHRAVLEGAAAAQELRAPRRSSRPATPPRRSATTRSRRCRRSSRDDQPATRSSRETGLVA